MKITDKARRLLSKQNITSFDINITSMDFDRKIIFDTIENYCKITGMPLWAFEQITDGCTIIRSGVSVVLTHRNSPQRTKWTLAHEIGHVYLGHVKDEEVEEREANLFAAELLMPELIILELQQKGVMKAPEEVASLFGVSTAAASVRLKQIKNRSFFSAYLKCELMEKYRDLINHYVKNKGSICQTIIVS